MFEGPLLPPRLGLQLVLRIAAKAGGTYVLRRVLEYNPTFFGVGPQVPEAVVKAVWGYSTSAAASLRASARPFAKTQDTRAVVIRLL